MSGCPPSLPVGNSPLSDLTASLLSRQQCLLVAALAAIWTGGGLAAVTFGSSPASAQEGNWPLALEQGNCDGQDWIPRPSDKDGGDLVTTLLPSIVLTFQGKAPC